MLELEKLVIGYGTTTLFAVEGSLRLGAGIHQLSGANGAGKSSLLKTLAGLEAPLGGSFSLSTGLPGPGQVGPRDPAWKSLLRYVPEHGGYWSDLSARENLELAGLCHGLSKSEAANRASTLLDWWGIEDRSTRAESMSSGQQKRLSLAFSLVHDARVLLLDEPFTTLDVDGLDIFRQFLELAGAPSSERILLIAAHGWPRSLDPPMCHLVLANGGLAFQDAGAFQDVAVTREPLPWII